MSFFVITNILLLDENVVFNFDIFVQHLPALLVQWSAWLNAALWSRTVAGAAAILVLSLLNLVNMVSSRHPSVAPLLSLNLHNFLCYR